MNLVAAQNCPNGQRGRWGILLSAPASRACQGASIFASGGPGPPFSPFSAELFRKGPGQKRNPDVAPCRVLPLGFRPGPGFLGTRVLLVVPKERFSRRTRFMEEKKASAAAQQRRISLLCVGFVRVAFLIVGTGSGLLVYCYPKNRDITRGECLPCTSFARPLKLSVTLPSGLPEIERCFEVLSIVPDKQEWWLGT